MSDSNGASNGAVRGEDKVRVALIGVGNCANSLLQGVTYYKDAADDQFVPGLMHVNLGGYHVRDIEFVAAFDVVKGKVGVDLAEAMWAHPNDTIKFADVAQDRREGLARHDPRRHRQVPLAGRREGARARPTTWSGSSRSARSTSSSTTCPSAPRWRPSGTPSRSSTPAARW